ncbi:division/cell wall cluster transcriptional repressor MraZ [Candidatus Dojkabacteria bacterium]|uniref:Transcriptional regulator MraZ n=1 Tax=Candidatus Dojkabacteria bacterium TaxID=2099670 RepID=A0A955L3Q1_9BACT|nr:division/cell wall cluster transcriptional repressor MraZ [Candidatus Dojkabacteria bacterium]
MLIGEYQSKLGEKNRVALPSRLRTDLGNNIIVTRGYENCLVIVRPDQFEALLKSINEKEFTLSEVRDTSRFLVGGAAEIELDNQGRMVLPKSLIEYANLKEDLTFIGLVRWVEIWSTDSWKERLDFLTNNSSEIAQKLEGIRNE